MKSVRIKHTLGKTAGLKQCEAQKDRRWHCRLCLWMEQYQDQGFTTFQRRLSFHRWYCYDLRSSWRDNEWWYEFVLLSTKV